MNFASRLKKARQDKGMSQEELAQLSGVTQQMISKYENGKTTLSAHLLTLAKALGLSPEWLRDGVGPRQAIDSLSEITLECAAIIETMNSDQRRTLRDMLVQLYK